MTQEYWFPTYLHFPKGQVQLIDWPCTPGIMLSGVQWSRPGPSHNIKSWQWRGSNYWVSSIQMRPQELPSEVKAGECCGTVLQMARLLLMCEERAAFAASLCLRDMDGELHSAICPPTTKKLMAFKMPLMGGVASSHIFLTFVFFFVNVP